MKKLYKEITVIPAGGTVTLKANDLNNYYMIRGNAVTLTAGFTIDIDAASKNNTVKIYWNQPVTIGAGGAITVLGNAVTEYDILEDLIIDCSYDGTAWKTIYTQNLSVSTLAKPLWNHTVTVNYDLIANDSARNMFKTYAEAITYINTQTPLTTDHWTVFLTSGYCNEDMIAYPFIDIIGATGTVIKSLIPATASTGTNIFDSVVRNCRIALLKVAPAKVINLINCVVDSTAPSVGGAADGYVEAADTYFLGGDFSNTISLLYWRNCNFLSLASITGIRVNLMDCDVNITNALTLVDNVHWRNTSTAITTLNISSGIKVTNCYFKAFTMNVTGSNAVFYNSEITGDKNVNNAATLDLHNSESNGGDIIMNDTSVLNLVGANEVDGTITLNDASTLVDDSAYYDNTTSSLAATTVKTAIDELKTAIDATDVTAAALLTDATSVAGQWTFAAGLIVGADVTAASAANVGAMRYRATANDSYCEMVMQDGAASYSWTVVKTNTW